MKRLKTKLSAFKLNTRAKFLDGSKEPIPGIVEMGNIRFGGANSLVVIAGPCVVEDRELALKVARDARKVTDKLRLPYVYKSSYKKANRTSGKSFVGIGMEEALKILQEVKQEIGVPILTDVHSEAEVDSAAEVADILQIPAFLCRQTDLLQSAGKTGRVVNIKKGQFMAPEDMSLQAEKVVAVGNARGTTDRTRHKFRLPQSRRGHEVAGHYERVRFPGHP